VAAVGFELYCELLAEAVAELQGAVPEVAPSQVRVDAAVDAYVPASYVGLEAAKMDVHRRIALAATVDDLRELEAELQDRFGPLPEPVANLIGLQEARIALAPLGPVALSVRRDRVAIAGVEVGPLELRTLRERVPGLLYAGARRELSLRPNVGEPVIETARNLSAGIIEVRSEVGAAAR
jgi:transcription-repair coupling factor (superfamily II helicase)